MDVESFRVYLRKYSCRKIPLQKMMRPTAWPIAGKKDFKTDRADAGLIKEGRESIKATR